MPLTTYEEFLDLSVKQLADYLTVRGLATTGRKIELVARAFTAMELKLPILESTEEQQKRLKQDYANKLQSLQLFDPNQIEEIKRIDDVTKWPVTTTGTIFSYILKKRDFDADYIGKYKDQKAYSYFDSGFVSKILVYEPKTKKYIVFLYCNVRASQSIHEEKRLWIAFEKISTTSSQILSAYCSCMAGAYECCNHIISTLYKVAYAHSMGWCTPSCTSLTSMQMESVYKEGHSATTY